MFFPGGNTTRRKTCLGAVVRAACLICASALTWATPARAAGAPVEAVDSQAWQARFEAWVEAALVSEQLDEAARNLSAFDPETTLRVLNELVMKRVETLRDSLPLPTEVVPQLEARGLEGPSLTAARHYARGELDAALRVVGDPALESDAQAAHLHAQLLDEHTRLSHSLDRIRTIAAYRYALSLSRNSPQAERARLRVGQILLELRFIPEATAALRGLLDARPSTPRGMAAHISFAEAAYLDDEPQVAIETIMKLDFPGLTPEARRWAIRRTADGLFQLRRFPAASLAYRKIIHETMEQQIVDPFVRLRLAAALIETGRASDAQPELRIMVSPEVPKRLAALASLLLARTARETESFEEASRVAHEVLQILPRSPEAALGAVEVLEAQRLAGNGELELPEAARELLDPVATTPEFGLLAYRVASVPGPNGSEVKVRGWLGNLLNTLPEGAVRELTHDDLAQRLQAHLKGVYEGTEKPDPAILEDVEKHLRPSLTDENALLVGLEAFYRSGRWSSCMRWGRSLYKREVRPIRRGLGAWREVQCKQAQEPELVSAQRLLDAADSGKSGPFALALTALAAEQMVQRDQLPKAVRVYERAVEAVAEPRLLGPSLLRLGELQLALGELNLGMRRLLHGLSLMDQDETVTDPFRKAGIVALGRALTHTKKTRSSQAARLLKRERGRAEPWWRPAYAYLGFRAGVGPAPEGNDLFSRAASQIKQADHLESRIKKLVGESQRSALKGKENPG